MVDHNSYICELRTGSFNLSIFQKQKLEKALLMAASTAEKLRHTLTSNKMVNLTYSDETSTIFAILTPPELPTVDSVESVR